MYENKSIQINKWPTTWQELSVAHENIDTQNLGKSDILGQALYSYIGYFDLILLQAPFTPNFKEGILPSKAGQEGVVKVVWIGEDVNTVKVGDLVKPTFSRQQEMWQKYVVFQNFNAKLPENFPPEQGAMLYGNPMTCVGLCYQLGFDLLDNKQKSEGWLVYNAANSFLARILQEFLNDLDIKTLGIVRRQSSIKDVLEQGATKCIAVGHLKSKEDITRAILDATDGQGAKYGLDTVGGTAAEALYEAVVDNGKFISYGAQVGYGFWSPPKDLNRPNVKYEPFYQRQWQMEHKDQIPQYMDYLIHKFYQNQLSLPVAKTFSLDDYKQAFEAFESVSNSRNGKVLFKNS